MVKETEMGEGEGDSERDEGRRRYLKADGDIDSR
jgi:hypothetical protein